MNGMDLYLLKAGEKASLRCTQILAIILKQMVGLSPVFIQREGGKISQIMFQIYTHDYNARNDCHQVDLYTGVVHQRQ